VYRDGEKLLFASEPKALLAHPDVPTEIDATALEDYLAFGVTCGTRSIFKGIERIAPGHVLTVAPDRLMSTPRRYWQLRFDVDHDTTADQWVEKVRSKVTESVRGHLLADVPVGAFLSGGLDSSVVTTTAASIQPGLRTFSVGFDDEQFDELPYARLVAERCGTTHTEATVTPDAVALLDELAQYYDEPFADSSAVPTFLLSRVARAHVKVALSGDGGDEAFGGYARYAHDLKEARLRDALPAWLRVSIVARLARNWPKADWLPRPLRAKTLLTNISLPAASAYANTLTVCRNPLRRTLVAPDVRRVLNGYEPEAHIRDAYTQAMTADPLAGMIAADVGVVLPDDYLVKVDRATMANGLEARPPLLDHELLETTARIPSAYKISRGATKWLLKECYSDSLPKRLLQRPKHGFEMPVERWMAGPLKHVFETTVLEPRTRIADLIDQTTARTLLREHCHGVARHGQILWSLLVLAHWAEKYIGRQSRIDAARSPRASAALA
jgi:asparagine synthase (glutamine-hydrolysing)